MLDLVLNYDGVDAALGQEPKRLISRVLFEQVLFRFPGLERREPERYFWVDSRLGMVVEIDTDEGERFGNIYLSAPEGNPKEARDKALSLARHLAVELGLIMLNPAAGEILDTTPGDALPRTWPQTRPGPWLDQREYNPSGSEDEPQSETRP